MKKTMLCFVALCLFTPHSFANEIIKLSKEESCEISDDMDIEGADYSKSDLKEIAKLCSYDIHLDGEEVAGRKAVAVCPKLNSTFPAVEFIKIPKDSTKAQVEARCNRKVGGKNNLSHSIPTFLKVLV